MTHCDTDALSLFLDGDLPIAQHRAVAEHLRACADCRDELAALRRLDQLITAWGSARAPIPTETEARVHQSVEKRRGLRPVFALSRMMPAALGTSVAAVLVLLTANLTPLYRGSAQPTPSTSEPMAAKLLKQQSAPLRYQRGKTAFVGTYTAPPPAIVDRHAELDIY